ncbi:rhamnulokinase [Celerinatantimonas sp. MCCC 1A17872]|uniref:rhamnulokinase n=1 Tax=Celerinatantimonas sp. MCCC 1A17872 TaxID=3177514 RepID=UPI0038CB437E
MIYQVAAVDLGASSGRVILGTFDEWSQSLSIEEIHRFNNDLIHQDGFLCWDVDKLEANILAGLNRISERGIALNSLGIDSWGVDYVCLNKDGKRLAPAVCYRDERTALVAQRLLDELNPIRLYRQTGIQFQPFNTIFQLRAQAHSHALWLNQIDKILMIPDYFHFRLCGHYHWDYTNASTTGMLNCMSRDWASNLLEAANVKPQWVGPLTYPGERIGDWQDKNGVRVAVISPPTHDTAAAVAATPIDGPNTAYISSGTWSLIGIESSVPVTDEQAFKANLTNEGGANRNYRILKNVMGMWLIEGLLKEWPTLNITQLIQQASKYQAFQALVDPNHASFVHPKSMRQAILSYCQKSHQSIEDSPAALARCVLDSLALSYHQAICQLEKASKHAITQIRIVGGGCQNQLLNQLCADVCQRVVLTGPVEASALGNLGYQLIGLHAIEDGETLRQLIARQYSKDTYSPRACKDRDAVINRFEQLTPVQSFVQHEPHK